jgi:hypothetical protein
MSISSVNPYMSMMATYKAAQEKSNTESTLQEVAETKPTTRPGDTVTISQEASQKSRAEQYALQDDPIEIFNKWLAEGSDVPYFSLGGAGMSGYTPEEILPENVPLLSELKQKAQQETDPEVKRNYMFKISVLEGLGSSEIFKTEGDIDARVLAENQSLYLKQQYLTEKYGNPNGAMDSEFIQRAEEAANHLHANSLPRLSSEAGEDNRLDDASTFQQKGIDLAEFNNKVYLEKLLSLF